MTTATTTVSPTTVLAQPASPMQAPAPARAAARVSSTALLSGARVLQIDHNGETYFLRLTRQQKLILCK